MFSVIPLCIQAWLQNNFTFAASRISGHFATILTAESFVVVVLLICCAVFEMCYECNLLLSIFSHCSLLLQKSKVLEMEVANLQFYFCLSLSAFSIGTFFRETSAGYDSG